MTRCLSCAIVASIAISSAFGQADDPALTAKMTFRERYMTLADLGRRVSESTHVQISVDRAVAERKVTVFCEDRAAGEIVDRVVKTLFLEWIKEEDGHYRLRLDPQVAQEERAILQKRESLAQFALQNAVREIAGLSLSTPEQLKQEEEDLRAAQSTPSKDPNKAADARHRYTLVQPFSYCRDRWFVGDVLRQAGDAAVPMLERGDTIYASTTPAPGMIAVSKDMYTGDRRFQSDDNPAGTILIGIRWDAENRQLIASVRSKCMATSDANLLADANYDDLGREALNLRILRWHKSDDSAVLSTKLDKPAELPKGSPDDAWTMADHMQWLHDRTGVPIVADAFHAYAGFNIPIQGRTIKEWIKNAYVWDDASMYTMCWSILLMTDKGWVMAKDRRYWEHLAQEIPQRFLDPLERKFERTGQLWIDDYMPLAAVITPAQESALLGACFHFPLRPLAGNVTILRLWNEAGPAGRRAAMRTGYVVTAMSPLAQSDYRRVLVEKGVFGLMDFNLVSNFLPGGPPLPFDMELFYADSQQPGVTITGQTDYPDHMRMGVTIRSESMPVRGARFEFGTAAGPRTSFTVQIGEFPKK